MNNFDLWNRYLDNSGKILQGCVEFMVRDGNTRAVIYDSDGTPISNPQLTDIYGRTDIQVFIDEDVVAYFFKYIGSGSFADLDPEHLDTSDQTKWALQYTIESQLDVMKNIVTDSVMSMGTMAQLRAVDPEDVPEVDGVKVLQLLGYNEIGDKEPVYYIWHEDSEVDDDGGSVIANDDLETGRWIMVTPTEHCDCRHFGVFPTDSYNTAPDSTYAIQKLIEYCNSVRLRPYFSAEKDDKIFRFQNLSIRCNDYIDVAEGTIFHDLGSNGIYGKGFNGDPLFHGYNTVLADMEVVKASWHARRYLTYKKVYLDEDISDYQNFWSNAEVVISYSPCVGYNFTDCVISETESLGTDGDTNNHFTKCNLTEKMFITSGDYKAVLYDQVTNCQFDIDDWQHNLDMWKQMRCTDDTNCSFDYRNFSNPGTPWGQYQGNKLTGSKLTVSNLINSDGLTYDVPRLLATQIVMDGCEGNFSFQSGVNVELRNCRNMSISVNGAIVTIYNSEVTLSNLGVGSSVSATDSTVTLATSPNLVNFNTKNCTITRSGSTQTISCQNFSAYSGILSVPVSCFISVVKDTQINQSITSQCYKADGSDEFWTMNAFFDGCIFNAKHILNVSESPTKMLGCWTDNVGNVADPIQKNNPQNFYESDSAHSYQYQGNTGTFIADEPVTQHSLYLGNTYKVTQNDNTAVVAAMGSAGYQTLEVCFRIPSTAAQTNKNITGVKFFRIGRDSFKVNVYSAIDMAFANGVSRPDWRYLLMPHEYQMQLNYAGSADTWYATMIPVPIIGEILTYDVSIARWTGAVPNTDDVSYSYLVRSKFSKM